jgi:hypothetical protein
MEKLISEHAKLCMWNVLDFDDNDLPIKHTYSGKGYLYKITNVKWNDQSVTFDLASINLGNKNMGFFPPLGSSN